MRIGKSSLVGLLFLLALGSVAGFWQLSQEKPLRVAGADAGYVGATSCKPCHSAIFETYQDTGMGRSFFRMRPEKAVEDWSRNNVFYHQASDRYYTMRERNGKYYQRRHQMGFDGKETNVIEKEIHYVMGSGNHVRTYLHLTPDRKLVQLPVAWYSEKGGYWAMNPSYDRRVHMGFRRRITSECMFCHNAYPEIEPGADTFGQEALFKGKIPEGIDCERCHGPGRDHLAEVQKPSTTPERIRGSIVNPGRMSPEQQMEVCMQCHLETTSVRLPPFIRRFGRSTFSFRPDEALADHILHFDHAPGAGFEEKFEIVNAAYRLRQSPCFQKSDGALTCLTCHDPHQIPRGEEASRHYVSVCRQCHNSELEKLISSKEHTASSDCLTCHMPKRRTDDVVHVVMTDHYIQRFKPDRDLLAPLDESQFYDRQYRGEVVLYYPATLPAADRELYLAVAQVKDQTNLRLGIPRLETAIRNFKPAEPEFYFELAEAYVAAGRIEKAIPLYEEALRRKPELRFVLHKLGVALAKSGQLSRAAPALEKAAQDGPEPGVILNDLAVVHRQLGKLEQAVKVLQKAIEVDAERPEAHNNLGAILLELDRPQEAEAAFREAIQLQPDLAGAHHNLAGILIAREDFPQAGYHLKKAIELNPESAEAHLNYGLVLALTGKLNEAIAHLRKAAEGPDSRIRREALEWLRKIPQK